MVVVEMVVGMVGVVVAMVEMVVATTTTKPRSYNHTHWKSNYQAFSIVLTARHHGVYIPPYPFSQI